MNQYKENTIDAPKWFIKDYPPFEIDGDIGV